MFKRVVRTFGNPQPDEGITFQPDWSMTDQRAPYVTPSLLVSQYLKANPVKITDDEEVIDIVAYDDISEFGSDIQTLGGIDKILAERRLKLSGAQNKPQVTDEPSA